MIDVQQVNKREATTTDKTDLESDWTRDTSDDMCRIQYKAKDWNDRWSTVEESKKIKQNQVLMEDKRVGIGLTSKLGRYTGRRDTGNLPRRNVAVMCRNPVHRSRRLYIITTFHSIDFH